MVIKQDSTTIDYQIEATRIIAIATIIVYHILSETVWFLTQDEALNVVKPFTIVIAILMFDSGFVHGLKGEFESKGSLNKFTYFSHIKKRFLRLYIGYYLAYIGVFIAKLINNQPITLNPFTLFLDLTNTWGILLGRTGGIWEVGWFICALFWLSVLYPFVRRLMSIRMIYVYIIITLSFCFIVFFFFAASHVAYFHPFAWIPEFFGGVLLGRNLALKGTRPKLATTRFQKIIIKIGARTYAIYLAHMAPILFLSYRPPIWDYLVAVIGILILSEGFYRLLKLIDNLRKRNKRYTLVK